MSKKTTALLEMMAGILKGDNGSWNTLNTSTAYTKRAGVVFVKGASSGSVNLTNNTWNNLGTLPSGYRPKTEVNFVAQDRSNNKPMMGRITTAGIISLYPEGGNSNYWLFTGVFPVVGGVVRKLLNVLIPERGWAM